MKTIAIIPARGGSKGIPHKNIAPLCGQPLIVYMIKAALGSKHISEVIVSTDDHKIAAIALTNGAAVRMRPQSISGDLDKSETALLDVLNIHNSDLLVFLQCTSPLTIAEDIDGTIEALIQNNADTALSVTEFPYFLWDKNGEGINHDKKIRLMRQEREKQYLETGAVYVMKTPEFRKYKHRFFGKTALYVMPPERVLEIDEPFDLELAENILKGGKCVPK
jgi:CMP-N-acetylneuraminic acid synthetase